MDYQEFLKSKMPFAEEAGFEPGSPCPEWFKPHQVDCSQWAISKGRAALFESFGMGKTCQQLQIARWVVEKTGGKFLIVAPLGVRQEFTRNDGPRMGMEVVYCRNNAEVEACDSPYIITNYERVRDGALDPAQFAGSSLDEASCLRSYGTKTTQNFCRLFRKVKYRFVATATPSPNDYIELINYADYLGVMDRGQAMTRFFQRDSKKAGNLKLYEHETERFWLWVASWAVFINRPSDLGYDDTGYDLPDLSVTWHEVKADMGRPGDFKDGHGRPLLFEKPGGGIRSVAKHRKATRTLRAEKAAELVSQHPEDHWLIWHYLETEREEIQKLIPHSKAVYGSQDLDLREDIVEEFANGELQILSSKPELLGSGCNFQRHCHKAIFIGPTDKFNDFIQAVHRIHRFLQDRPVEIHIIFADSQYDTVQIMQRKWKQHDELTAKMRRIILDNGLSGERLKMKFERSMGTERTEVSGKTYRAINNDCVEELKNWESDSVDQIVTSIPFSDHYEYSPNYNDFGHNHGDDGFFKQFDYLVPELHRVLKPGRVACIHTKDRIQYGTMTGNGMYSVNEFSDKTVAAFKRHGWVYMGRIVIDTDVVRENAQTYRLGWTENAKDSTKMGCGSTEFLLLFRKWEPSMSPNQTANGPFPVEKDKEEYSRARWQIHASGIWRSSGNELVSPSILSGMEFKQIYHWWRNHAIKNGYDYHNHVELTEKVESMGILPSGMMLLAPTSSNPDIWTDILRIKTLNTDLSRKTTESHVCLARGSLVLTKDRGYVPIQDVELGDLVLTHRGRWRPVIAKRNTGVNPVVKVTAQGTHELTLTPTHRVWSRDTRGKVRKPDAAKKSEPDWHEAKDLGGHYLNMKLPPVEEPENTDELHWWIVGRFLADGHVEKRGGIVISVGEDKVSEFMEKVGELAGNPAIRTAHQFRIRDRSRAIRNITDKCGKNAHGKHLPPEAFTLTDNLAKALLEGYLSGDGHLNKDRNRWYATSVSKELLMGLSVLVQRVFGCVASIHPGRKPGTKVIEGRTVNTRQEWVLSWGGVSHSFSFILDDGSWKKVRKVEPAGESETWNLRVAEDESYTAEGCVVKNCPLQLDVIERCIERYSNEGDLILDPFGGIHSTGYQAILMKRKAACIELNPEYWKFGVMYCERAEQKMTAPTLFDLEELAGIAQPGFDDVFSDDPFEMD